MDKGDAPVRVSNNAWNRGAAWQAVPDWQPRGSTGTATSVTSGPRGLAKSTGRCAEGAWQERFADGCACVPRSCGGIPMRVTSAHSHGSRSLPWVGVWKQVTALGLQGPLPSVVASDLSLRGGRSAGLGRHAVTGRILGTERGHHRNARNEQICCARGTENIGELGIVPLSTAMAAGNSAAVHAVGCLWQGQDDELNRHSAIAGEHSCDF